MSDSNNQSENVQPDIPAAGEAQAPPAQAKKKLWKPLALVAAVIVLMVIGRFTAVDQWLNQLRDNIEAWGPWGPGLFAGAYILATVACIPGTVFSVMGGALFGPVWGVIWVSIGSTIGAGACFLIARYFARDAIGEWIASKPKFAKMDKMTHEHGALMVLGIRFLPIFPFNLLNYGFGLTQVPFWTYFFLTWIGMLPGTVMYVVGSAALFEALQEGRVPWLLIGVVLAFMVILTVLARHIRKIIVQKEGASSEASLSENPAE